MQEKKEFKEIKINEYFVYKGFVFKKRSSYAGSSHKFGELFIKPDEEVETYEGGF